METELTGILRSGDAGTSSKLRRVKINQASTMQNVRWQDRRVGFSEVITPSFEAKDYGEFQSVLDQAIKFRSSMLYAFRGRREVKYTRKDESIDWASVLLFVNAS